MEITTLPPITLSPVDETVLSWQYLEAQSPVDFTQEVDGTSWSAEIIIWNCGVDMLRAPVALAADGGVSVTIPASTSAALRSARRIDAHFQIRFTAPIPDFNMVWQGPATVLEIRP